NKAKRNSFCVCQCLCSVKQLKNKQIIKYNRKGNFTNMPVNLKGRSLDSLLNFTTDEVNFLIDTSIDLKKAKYINAHATNRPFIGKNIAILFQKDSTRTRCAFEVAAADLGAGVTYIGPQGSNFGKKESIEDTAKVLGRFYDGIEFRGFAQSDIDALVQYSGVPVFNGLTDDEHPTQIIADFMTMKEQFGELKGKKVVFIGDIKNNVGHSVLIGAAFTGMHVTLIGPKKYHSQMRPEVIKACQKLFALNGGSLSFSDDKINAFHDNHTEFSAEVSKKFGKKYPVVKTGAMEVDNEVFQSKYNKSFDQAENRMHSIKAIMLAMIGS
uniref:ornithine carbamoyltransferase n=1 Tax=Gouania willdenowi TaxID=441366 RepID=A0A8C5N772_GOUWI